MANPTIIKNIWQAMDEALEMDAAKEAVSRLGLKADNTAADRAKAMGFSNTEYHGTKTDFDKFLPEKIRGGRTAFFTAPKPNTANEFSGFNLENDFNRGLVYPQVMPLRTRGKIFDYENPEHLKALHMDGATHNTPYDSYDISKGEWYAIENKKIQNAIKKLGFDGFNVAEHGTKNKGIYNPANIRSKFAKFNPKYAGIGAGSIMSSNLLANEKLQNTIEQNTSKLNKIGKGLITAPDFIGETVGGALLNTLGVASPFIKGMGLGGLLYSTELGASDLPEEEFRKKFKELIK